MNRYPIAKPPRWWSPKPSIAWMWLSTPLRRYQQKRKDRLLHIHVRGLEKVQEAIERRQGVLITPNHPGHSDGYLLWEALCRLRRRCYVMTTWQVFQMASWRERWHYRWHGCFSIDRDGNDRRAYDTAVRVLAETACPLVIFPEGEVYHLNERVTPFREGTAAIAHAAWKRAERPIACFPCALKYQYLEDPTAELAAVIQRVEEELEQPPRPESALAERVQGAIKAFVQMRESEYFPEVQAGPLQQRIDRLHDNTLAQVDARYGVSTAGRPSPERCKRLRQLAVERMGKLPRDDGAQEQIGRDLEDIFRCGQLYSYPADYVPERPTIERVAETIDKLEEDVLGVPSATIRRAGRAGSITFDEPVVISERGARGSGRELSETLRERVQQLLDASVR
jgi:hypothetical protein